MNALGITHLKHFFWTVISRKYSHFTSGNTTTLQPKWFHETQVNTIIYMYYSWSFPWLFLTHQQQVILWCHGHDPPWSGPIRGRKCAPASSDCLVYFSRQPMLQPSVWVWNTPCHRLILHTKVSSHWYTSLRQIFWKRPQILDAQHWHPLLKSLQLNNIPNSVFTLQKHSSKEKDTIFYFTLLFLKERKVSLKV